MRDDVSSDCRRLACAPDTAAIAGVKEAGRVVLKHSTKAGLPTEPGKWPWSQERVGDNVFIARAAVQDLGVINGCAGPSVLPTDGCAIPTLLPAAAQQPASCAVRYYETLAGPRKGWYLHFEAWSDAPGAPPPAGAVVTGRTVDGRPLFTGVAPVPGAGGRFVVGTAMGGKCISAAVPCTSAVVTTRGVLVLCAARTTAVRRSRALKTQKSLPHEPPHAHPPPKMQTPTTKCESLL